MKNIVKSTLAVALIGLAVTGCKKGDITSKRLDGTWTLSSGTKSSTSTQTGTSGSSSSSKYDYVYDGATRKITSTIGTAAPNVTTNPYTEEYTFTKSNSTYTSKVVSTDTDTYTGYYYTTATCDWASAGDYDVTATMTTTANYGGSFTILGSTGDIEKNSRLLLEPTSYNASSTTKYTYKNNGSDVTVQLYSNTSTGCKPVDVTKTSTSSSTASLGNSSVVWTVKQMDSSSMTVDVSSSDSDTNADGSKDSNTETGELNFKQN